MPTTDKPLVIATNDAVKRVLDVMRADLNGISDLGLRAVEINSLLERWEAEAITTHEWINDRGPPPTNPVFSILQIGTILANLNTWLNETRQHILARRLRGEP